jgi:hypothetical protein
MAQRILESEARLWGHWGARCQPKPYADGHGVGCLCRGQAWARARARATRWTRGGGLGRPCFWAEKWGGGPFKKENPFSFCFSTKTSQNPIFEQEKNISRVWCKNKSCLEFCVLQLCQKEQSKF